MMQFTAAVFMTALTMKLLMLSGRHPANKGAANSRWLMVSGTLTLALHFALQLALGLRQMGVTQAVMLNLAMFIPTTFFFAWAILLLQRRGQLSRTDWLVGPITWIVVMAMLGAAATTDGQPLLSGTPELRHAEIAGAAVYVLDSFCSYLNSSAPARILEAEVNADEVEQEIVGEKDVAPTGGEGGHLTDEAMQAIDKAVAAWTARGEHCQTGLLLPLAAAGIGVPKYRLTCWLHQKGLKYTDWIASLRVEEAKRTIKAHPDWQNEAVAEHCGFTERTLLRTFKKLTGMTPAQYADHGA